MLGSRLACLGSGRPIQAASALTALTAVAAASAVVAATAGAARAVAEPVSAAVGGREALARLAYRGYSFGVPRSWPVIILAAHPRTCVRFDVHAVYLGSPPAAQSCPSRLVGTTEALLIQPGPWSSARSAVEDPVARRITVTAPRVRITASFDADPGQIYRILASASLPAPVIEYPSPPAHPSGRAQRAGTAQNPAPMLSAKVANYHGLGFDTCTAPTGAYMRTWRRLSPYRAIGVYIGGSDAACSQPNLTPRWLRRQTRAGWRVIPMYVGPQAEFGEISASAPRRQGRAAADDAVTQAERLGFGPRTPLYYDMEWYPPGQATGVLPFLSAWTSRLHALGYSSGVYSSSSAGIAALAGQYFGGEYLMPDVIDDALWNGQANTQDTVYQAGEWTRHRRVHQFAGAIWQTYGGDGIDIDIDYLNVGLHAPTALAPVARARS